MYWECAALTNGLSLPDQVSFVPWQEEARNTLEETVARLETAAALKYAALEENAALEYFALEESTASEYASLKDKTDRTTTGLEKTAALLTEVQAQLKAVEEEKAEMFTKMDERMDYVVELTEDLNQTRAELNEATVGF
jgi:chromosome segregation ATPase